MIALQQAVDKAKNFLSTSAGVPTLYCTLNTVSKENTKWVVTFKYSAFMVESLYTVEVDDKGEIIGYTRGDIK